MEYATPLLIPLIHELGHWLAARPRRASLHFTFEWGKYYVPLADAQTVLLEMSTAFAMAHAKKQALRAQTAEAQTQSDLDSIIW